MRNTSQKGVQATARAVLTGRRSGPLASYEREYIVHLGVLGNTRAQVIEQFKKRYQRPLSMRTVSAVWKKAKDQIAEAKDKIAVQGAELVSGDSLKQGAYKLLDNRIKRAESDETEIDKLRLQLKTGQITKPEFDRDVARYEHITINELVKIAELGFDHAHKAGEGPSLTPEDQAMLSLLTQSLQSGNPVNLIQVLNPTIHAAPSVENPGPPVDIL